MTETLQLRLENVFAREDFQKEAQSVRSIDELLSLLSRNGIDLSEEDIDYCMRQAENAMMKNGYMTDDGELSEEMLEIVAGGGAGGSILGMVFGGAIVYMGTAGFIAKAGIAGYTACMAIGGACCVVGGAFIVAGAIGLGVAIYKSRQKKKGR